MWEHVLECILYIYGFLLVVGSVTSPELMECNYCFSADRKQDCYLTTITCELGEVCFTDTLVITYINSEMKKKTMVRYEMGCNYGYLCFDGIKYGPGPFGYSRVVRQCCCENFCTKADGTGRGETEHCPHAQLNETTLYSGTTTIATPHLLILCLLLVCRWLTKVTYS